MYIWSNPALKYNTGSQVWERVLVQAVKELSLNEHSNQQLNRSFEEISDGKIEDSRKSRNDSDEIMKILKIHDIDTEFENLSQTKLYHSPNCIIKFKYLPTNFWLGNYQDQNQFNFKI